MAELRHLLIFCLLIFGFVASEIPQELTDSAKNCENACLKTFPSDKSNSVEKLSDACQRGCRFFLLVNSVPAAALQSPLQQPSRVRVVTPAPPRGPPLPPAPTPEPPVSKENEVSPPQKRSASSTPAPEPIPSARTNSSKEACQASCMEAYKRTNERYACHEGCANMARETARAEERVRQALLAEGARELASLGPLLNSVISQLYAAAVQTPPRLAVLVQAETTELEGPSSLQGEAEIVRTEDIFLLPQESSQPEQEQVLIVQASSDSEPADDVLTDPALLRQLEAAAGGGAGVLDVSLRLPEQRMRTFPAVEQPRQHGQHHQAPQANVPADLLACLSTRYGVPKWLLGFLALLTGVLTAWLCLEPWDRAAILEDTSNHAPASDKTLLIDTEDEEDEDIKIPLPEVQDVVKVPLGDTLKV